MRELQWRLPGAELVPMVRLLIEDVVEPPGDAAGFVSPIHGLTVPIPVRRFVAKLDPGSAGYLFAIATRAATPHRAFAVIDRILKAKGRRLDAFFTLTMPGNDPKFRDWRARRRPTRPGASRQRSR